MKSITKLASAAALVCLVVPSMTAQSLQGLKFTFNTAATNADAKTDPTVIVKTLDGKDVDGCTATIKLAKGYQKLGDTWQAASTTVAGGNTGYDVKDKIIKSNLKVSDATASNPISIVLTINCPKTLSFNNASLSLFALGGNNTTQAKGENREAIISGSAKIDEATTEFTTTKSRNLEAHWNALGTSATHIYPSDFYINSTSKVEVTDSKDLTLTFNVYKGTDNIGSFLGIEGITLFTEQSVTPNEGDGVATFVLPYSTTAPEGCTLYQPSEYANGVTKLTDVTSNYSDGIPAGTAILVQGTPNTEIKLPAKEFDKASPVTAYASMSEGMTVKGVYEASEQSDVCTNENNCFVLAKPASGLGLYPLASGQKAPACKMLCIAPTQQANSAKAYMSLDFGKLTTGINTATTTTSSKTYDLSGKQISSSAKGLIINNGKKIIK